MSTDKFSRTSLKIYASLVLLGALGHALWQFLLPGYAEMKGLTGIQISLMLLMNASIGSLLLFFSILGYWFSSKSFSIQQRRTFAILMSVFWLCRLLFEFIYPLQIPFVVIPNPTLFIKMLGISLVAILVSPWLVSRTSYRQDGLEQG